MKLYFALYLLFLNWLDLIFVPNLDLFLYYLKSHNCHYFVEPDSVYCPIVCEDTIFITNNGILPVDILNFPLGNFFVGWEWFIEDYFPVFPITLNPGDSLGLSIVVAIYPGNLNETDWVCDEIYWRSRRRRWGVDGRDTSWATKPNGLGRTHSA